MFRITVISAVYRSEKADTPQANLKSPFPKDLYYMIVAVYMSGKADTPQANPKRPLPKDRYALCVFWSKLQRRRHGPGTGSQNKLYQKTATP